MQYTKSNEYKLMNIAKGCVKSYISDGYAVRSFEHSEADNCTWFSLVHDNGNMIDIEAYFSMQKIRILKNRKLNKEISLNR